MTEETLHIAGCPLTDTHQWRSEPLSTDEAALEAARTHLNGHTHGDLVDFVARSVKVTRYREET